MTLQLQQPPAPAVTTLEDGSTSWNQVAMAALADWNQYITILKFASVVSAQPPPTSESSTNNNNVFWDDTVLGDSWGRQRRRCDRHHHNLDDNDVGQRRAHDHVTEADVLFNTNVAWNSYRGALQNNVSDLKRVALHEFAMCWG